MHFHEQIYTSAPQLLEGGAGNLGVVAQTRAFPRELDGDLAQLRSYTMLPDLPLDPIEQHPPRYVIASRGPARRWFTITQIVFAGADHTGRTTPLAHHLAFDRAQLKSSQRSPADILRLAHALFHRQWREPPKWIDPPRNLDGAISPPRPIPKSLIPIAESLVNFDLTHRPILLVIPPQDARNSLDLIADLYCLLPESIQYSSVCATHVIDAADYVRDASLLISYPQTPFAAESLHRRDPRAPIVIDPAAPLHEPQAGAYAQLLRENWTADGARPMILEEWDALGLAPEHADPFLQAIHLRDAMRNAKVSPQDIAPKIAALDPAQPSFQIIADAAIEMLARIADDATTLARITMDSRWPPPVRQAAFDAVTRTPAMITSLCNDSPDDRFRREITLPILRRQIDQLKAPGALPPLCEALIETSLKTNSAPEEIRQLLSKRASQITSDMAARWLNLARGAGQEASVRQVLIAARLLPDDKPIDVAPAPVFIAYQHPAGDDDLRRRARIRVGPIRTPAILSLVAIPFGLSWATIRFFQSHSRWPALLAGLLLAFAPLAGRLVFEWLVRRFVHDVNKFWIIRILRWLLTLGILAALVLFARVPVQSIASLFHHNTAPPVQPGAES